MSHNRSGSYRGGLLWLSFFLFFLLAMEEKDTRAEVFRTPVDETSAHIAQIYNNLNSHYGGYHTGIDYTTTNGNPNIYAAASGKVVLVQPLDPNCVCLSNECPAHVCTDHGLGNSVVIDHQLPDGSHIYSLYGHLSEIRAKKDDCVLGGTIIGIMGSTANGCSSCSFGVHLHFEIKDASVLKNPSGTGQYWGYTLNSADNYGYHDPQGYIGQGVVSSCSAALWHPDGTLIQEVGKEGIYFIRDGFKHLIDDEAAFIANGFKWEYVIPVSKEEIECLPTGVTIKAGDVVAKKGWGSFPEGHLIQFEGDYKVYVVSNNQLHHLDVTSEQFTSFGYEWDTQTYDSPRFNMLPPLSFTPNIGETFSALRFKKQCKYPQCTLAGPQCHPWPTEKANSSLTMTSEYVGPSGSAGGIPPNPDCPSAQYGGRFTTLANNEGILFVTGAGETRSFNPNGTLRWVTRIGWTTLEGDTLYGFGCQLDNPLMPVLFHYDQDTASHKKVIPLKQSDFPLLEGECTPEFVMANGATYTAMRNTIYAIDRTDGSKRWEFVTRSDLINCAYDCFAPHMRPPALSPDGTTLYAVSNGRMLYALNTLDGSLRWKHHVDAGPYASSAIPDADGTVFISGWDDVRNPRVLTALYPDGSIKWEIPSMEDIGQLLAVGPHGLYTKVSSGAFAYDKQNGSRLWFKDLNNREWRHISISADGTLYVLGTTLHALDPHTGTTLFTFGGPFSFLDSGSSNVALTPKNGLAFMAGDTSGWSCLQLLRQPIRTLAVLYRGNGSLTSDPPGIQCPGTCEADFEKDMVVKLIPTPSPGWKFDHWEGHPDCKDGDSLVLMEDDRSCDAWFVEAPNNPPMANAGIDRTVPEGSAVSLNGTGSFDPEGAPLTFTWSQAAGPTVTLDSSATAHPTFTAPQVNANTTLTFQLVVNDGTTNSAPDTVNVLVKDTTPKTLTASLSASPTSVKVGKLITVTMKVTNTNSKRALVTPSALTVTGTGLVSLSSGPKPSSATIKAGGFRTFTWQYQAKAAGTVRFTDKATSPKGESPLVTSNDVTIP